MSSALNDEIRRATGGPSVNEGLSTWFTRTASESLNDAERRWLKAQLGITASSIKDCWYQFLRAAPNSYTGSVNDMKLAYWKAQP